MTVTAHLHAHAGDLIAHALPPCGIWVDILAGEGRPLALPRVLRRIPGAP